MKQKILKILGYVPVLLLFGFFAFMTFSNGSKLIGSIEAKMILPEKELSNSENYTSIGQYEINQLTSKERKLPYHLLLFSISISTIIGILIFVKDVGESNITAFLIGIAGVIALLIAFVFWISKRPPGQIESRGHQPKTPNLLCNKMTRDSTPQII